METKVRSFTLSNKKSTDNVRVELLPAQGTSLDTMTNAWLVGGATLKMCLKNQTLIPSQPLGGEYMIVRSSVAQEIVVTAKNELLVYAPYSEEPIVGEVVVDDTLGTYHIYTTLSNSTYQSQLDYRVKPKIAGTKIEGLGMSGVTEIIEWYEGGYDGFAPGYGVGIVMLAMPTSAPPNTSNYDNFITGFSNQFMQDISNWCVPNTLTTPAGFEYLNEQIATETDEEVRQILEGRLARLPKWGTCPVIEPVPPAIEIPSYAMEMRGISYAGAGHILLASQSPLTVVWNNKVILANTENLDHFSDTYAFNYFIPGNVALLTPNEKLYAWHENGASQIDGFYLQGLYEVVKWYDHGYVRISQPGMSIGEHVVKLPTTAPKTEDLSYMGGIYLNDASIGSWDVSGTKIMDYFLRNCITFNQDLSNMCVGTIFSRPEQFWPVFTDITEEVLAREPKWGTCPLQPNYQRPWPLDENIGDGSYSKVVIPPGEKAKVTFAQSHSRTTHASRVTLRILAGDHINYGVNTSGSGQEIIAWNLPLEYLERDYNASTIKDVSAYGLENVFDWYLFPLMYKNISDQEVTLEIISDRISDFRVATELYVAPVVVPGEGETVAFTPEDTVMMLMAYDPANPNFMTDVTTVEYASNAEVNSVDMTVITVEEFYAIFWPGQEPGIISEFLLDEVDLHLLKLTSDQAMNMETESGYYAMGMELSNKFLTDTEVTALNSTSSAFRFALIKKEMLAGNYEAYYE